MARYKTLDTEAAAAALEAIKGMEPLVVDGKLMAVIIGPLRLYTSKDQLVVSQQEGPPHD